MFSMSMVAAYITTFILFETFLKTLRCVLLSIEGYTALLELEEEEADPKRLS